MPAQAVVLVLVLVLVLVRTRKSARKPMVPGRRYSNIVQLSDKLLTLSTPW